METPEFVNFGDISRSRLGQQCQYGVRYIKGEHGFPCFGTGLRFKGETSDYHSMQIHVDDIEEFVRRVQSHRNGRYA